MKSRLPVPKQGIQHPNRLPLHAHADVAVEVQGDRDCRVTEHLSYLRVDMAAQHQGRGRVAKVMEPHPRQASTVENPTKGVVHAHIDQLLPARARGGDAARGPITRTSRPRRRLRRPHHPGPRATSYDRDVLRPHANARRSRSATASSGRAGHGPGAAHLHQGPPHHRVRKGSARRKPLCLDLHFRHTGLTRRAGK